MVGEPGTYRFTLTGFPTGQAGTVTIEFLPGSFADGAGTTDVGSTAEFFLAAPVGGAASATGPTATLSSPAPGEAVTAAALNAAGYIDITYASHNGSPIDESFLNTLAPFTITGTGAANVKSISGVLQLVGAPEALDGGSTTDTSVTYRYFLVAVNSSAPLFTAGTVTITFNQTFKTADGTASPTGMTQTFTVSASAPGAATTSKTISLGPLSLQGPSAGLENVGFKNGMLDLTVVLGVNTASLAFGGSQGASGVSATLTGLQGTLEVQLDVLGLLSGHVRIDVPGKFSLSVASLDGDDPADPQLSTPPACRSPMTRRRRAARRSSSSRVRRSASPRSASLARSRRLTRQRARTSRPPSANTIPGLTVFGDGLTFGQAELTLAHSDGTPITFGSIITFNDIRFGVENFSINFDGPQAAFNGSIFFATGGASCSRASRSPPRSPTAAPSSTPTARPTPRRCG